MELEIEGQEHQRSAGALSRYSTARTQRSWCWIARRMKPARSAGGSQQGRMTDSGHASRSGRAPQGVIGDSEFQEQKRKLLEGL